MKPETLVSLARAESSLAKAKLMLDGGYPDEAGRLAYGAGLNAARAYIFEHTGKVTKTHSGTQSEFSRLAKDDPAFEVRHGRFLGTTFSLKTSADYGEPPESTSIAGAQEAMSMGVDFVSTIKTALSALPGEKPS